MKVELKDYISGILQSSPEGADIEFEVCLYANGTVAYEETGNKIKFTVCNVKEVKNEN